MRLRKNFSIKKIWPVSDLDPDPGFGSGFESWIRILLFSLLTFKMPTKNYFWLNIFYAYYCLKVQLHNFPKIKVKKSHKIVGIKVFLTIFLLFCMKTEGSRSGSIPLTNGSGSEYGGPKTCGTGGSGSGTLD